MFRLRDGLICLLEINDCIFVDSNNGTIQIAGLKRPLTDTELELLSLGTEQPQSDPVTSQLLEHGLLQQGSLVDETMVMKIRDIEQSFTWRRSSDKDAETVLQLIQRTHSMKRLWRYDLQQTPLLPESVVRKAFALGRGNNRIMLLGDDDFLSLALSRLGHQPAVIDADSVLLKTIEQQARSQRLDINTKKLDICSPLPDEYIGGYDVVVCEPPSQVDAMKLFLSRALSAVEAGGFIWVSVIPEFKRRFHRLCNEARVEVVSRHDRFCSYYTPRLQLATFCTDLWVLQKRPDTVPFVDPHDGWSAGALTPLSLLQISLDLHNCDRDTFTDGQCREFITAVLGPITRINGCGDSKWGDMLHVETDVATAIFHMDHDNHRMIVDLLLLPHTLIGVDAAAEARSMFRPQFMSSSIRTRGSVQTADLAADCRSITTISLV